MSRLLLVLAVFLLGIFVSNTFGQDSPSSSPSLAEQLDREGRRAAEEEYQLRYKFEQDEVLRTEVTHLVTIQTRIRGKSQTAQTRSVSLRNWRIVDVADNGDITLVHSIEWVNMWQQASEQQAVSYNSRTDSDPPLVYQQVAETVGIPLSTVTISNTGEILNREDHQDQTTSGEGELTLQLPREQITVGRAWHTDEEIRLPLRNGGTQAIRIRLRYELENVTEGVAEINMRTQVLTPIHDPWLEAAMVQRMQNGTIRFDIEAGRVLSKQLDMDETVIGFEGPDSSMNYLARFTDERAEPSNATAATPRESTTER